MTQEIINQLWQAIKEAETAYDFAMIFNHTNIKGGLTSERKNT